jgi:hypothetical protein
MTKKREQDTRKILKDAKVPEKTIKQVIKQAKSTGKGLSVNEAKFLQNQASMLSKQKITNKNQAKVFLGTVDQRKDYNAKVDALRNAPPPPPPNPPSVPQYNPAADVQVQPGLVRIPERDVVSLAGQSVDSETIVNLLFENIGAVELTKFVRHDTVDGINPYYDIISNLSEVKRRFDPSRLISIQKPDSSNFDIYSIKLQDKIPDDEYLSNNNINDYVYFDNTTGDLVIEVINMSESEIVEVQIDTSGTIYRIEES